MKTFKVALILIGFLLLHTVAMKGQSKYHVILDYHYTLGLSQRFMGQTFKREEYNMHGNSIHLMALYDINRKMSAGVGIGADQYEEPGSNTFPIFGTFRYHPLKKIPNGYAFTNLGYGAFKGDDIVSGWMWDAGIGFTRMFRKHFGLNFEFGYNLKEFHGIPVYEIDWENATTSYIGKKNSIRHSLSFGLGLVF